MATIDGEFAELVGQSVCYVGAELSCLFCQVAPPLVLPCHNQQIQLWYFSICIPGRQHNWYYQGNRMILWELYRSSRLVQEH